MGAELERVVGFMDELLDVDAHPDYRTALNGLQVEGPAEVDVVVSAVDTSEATIAAAIDHGADLMLVHHGAFWSGLQPLVGRHYRRMRALIEGEVALYSAHLPLDAHPDVGNCALLMRALGLEPAARFGGYEGAPLGWRASTSGLQLDELARRLSHATGGGDVRVIAGSGSTAGEVAVVTGGGGSFIGDAAKEGIDTLVTGEGAHHTFTDAHELGVNVLYGGHYATETFGVRALGDELARRFGVTHTFVDVPSGL
ncbi:MAG TPA: Nif3-like dinuclear metal center hexameric protein [Longimicrobiales bacterium]|nr:Nif3-like dinuclear metal center hexameric protein [Longimicrobiales bacterium]